MKTLFLKGCLSLTMGLLLTHYSGAQNLKQLSPIGQLVTNQVSIPLAEEYELKPSTLDEIIQGGITNWVLPISYNFSFYQLHLQVHSPLTEDFRVRTSNGETLTLSTPKFFKGTVAGVPNSLAAITVVDGTLSGFISLPGLELNIVTLNNGNLCLYPEDPDFRKERSQCIALGEVEKSKSNNTAAQKSSYDKCIEVYMEVGYDVYQHFGNTSSAHNFISSAFNQVAILFSNAMVKVRLKEVFVWTEPSGYSTVNAQTTLNSFKNNHAELDADLAHYVDLNLQNGDAAFIGGLCNLENAFGYSAIETTYKNVPNYSLTVHKITHGIGHNIGSPHTNDCSWDGGPIDNCAAPEGSCAMGPAPQNGGTIMSLCDQTSTGINFNNGFGDLPKALLQERVLAAECLGDCLPPCYTPDNLDAYNTSENSSGISWSAPSYADNFLVRYRVQGISEWDSVYTSNKYIYLNNLTPHTDYEVSIKGFCGSGFSDYSASLYFTTLSENFVCEATDHIVFKSITSTTMRVKWNIIIGAEWYTVRYRPTYSQNWTEVETEVNALTVTGLQANTPYEFAVKTVCQNGESDFFGTIEDRTLPADAPVSYCESRGLSTDAEWIQELNIANLNVETGNNNGKFSGNQYVDLVMGDSYNFRLVPGFPRFIIFTLTQPEYWRIWIDWNGDGDYEDHDELVFDLNGTSTANVQGSFSVPTWIAQGVTTMRVAMKNGSAPGSCEQFDAGEVEEYPVKIINPDGGIQTPGTTTVRPGFTQDLSVYPNPVNGKEVNLSLNWLHEAASAELQLLDLQGRIVQSEEVFLKAHSKNRLTFGFNTSDQGVFLVRIVSEKGSTAPVRIIRQ